MHVSLQLHDLVVVAVIVAVVVGKPKYFPQKPKNCFSNLLHSYITDVQNKPYQPATFVWRPSPAVLRKEISQEEKSPSFRNEGQQRQSPVL